MNRPEKIILTEEELQKAFDEIDSYFIDLNPLKYSPDLFTGYDRVIVTGPHRSGTTFTAKALASSLGFRFVDETEFGVNKFDLFKSKLKETNIVVQAPSMSSRIHMAAGKNDLVVFMSRKWSDIIKSVFKKNGRLSNWIYQDTMYELEKYHIQQVDPNIDSVYDNIVDKDSYYLNCFYSLWRDYISRNISNCFALDYESMKQHPLWVEKENRKRFHYKQTSL